jgi:hypothetical protein
MRDTASRRTIGGWLQQNSTGYLFILKGIGLRRLSFATIADWPFLVNICWVGSRRGKRDLLPFALRVTFNKRSS